MSNHQSVWVDPERCTGCGVCVDVCPVEAIAVVAGTARVHADTCTGCEACIGACPEEAIQPVLRGELVPASSSPPPVVRRSTPLADTAAMAVATAGVGLLAKAAGAMARAIGPLLTQRVLGSAPSSVEKSGSAPGGDVAGRGGRRARHRRRGR